MLAPLHSTPSAEAAEARGRLRHDVALKEASGEPGRRMGHGVSSMSAFLVGKRVAEDSDERIASVGEKLGQ